MSNTRNLYPALLNFNAWNAYIAASDAVYRATGRASNIDYARLLEMLLEYAVDQGQVYATLVLEYLAEHGVRGAAANELVQFCVDELICATGTFIEILDDSRQRARRLERHSEHHDRFMCDRLIDHEPSEEKHEPIIQAYNIRVTPRYQVRITIHWSGNA